jgi:RecA/RadA recombinase
MQHPTARLFFREGMIFDQNAKGTRRQGRVDMTLQTLSLAQVVDYIKNTNDTKQPLSSGVVNLDHLLGSSEPGFHRGSVVEVCGPPGTGKTVLGLTLALDALCQGHKAIWISTSGTPIPLARMSSMRGYSKDMMKNLYHTNIRALSSLLMFFKSLSSGQITPILGGPPKYAIIVIDEIMCLVNTLSWSDNNRRNRALNALFDAISTYAQASHTAVLVLSSMIARSAKFTNRILRLVPGLGYGIWQHQITRRITLYRDDDVGFLYAKVGDYVVRLDEPLSRTSVDGQQKHDIITQTKPDEDERRWIERSEPQGLWENILQTPNNKAFGYEMEENQDMVSNKQNQDINIEVQHKKMQWRLERSDPGTVRASPTKKCSNERKLSQTDPDRQDLDLVAGEVDELDTQELDLNAEEIQPRQQSKTQTWNHQDNSNNYAKYTRSVGPPSSPPEVEYAIDRELPDVDGPQSDCDTERKLPDVHDPDLDDDDEHQMKRRKLSDEEIPDSQPDWQSDSFL